MIRVLGVGAPVGDDAVGLEVVRELVRRGPPAGVEARAVAEPSQLVTLIAESERVIIVDALMDGSPPGSVRLFSPAPPVPPRGAGGARGGPALSTHGVSVLEAIELARIVSPGARQVDVVGVTIGPARPLEGLSDAVARAVPAAADLVAAMLAS